MTSDDDWRLFSSLRNSDFQLVPPLMKSTLLPSGLMDVLPPKAMAEFRLIHQLLSVFFKFGYEPVIPPLAEYETSLLSGAGEATAHHVFRVADPLSPNMLALRADMTGQVARIATSVLSNAPRPLRLCYAGYTLRTMAEALKTRRQHTQVGIERFGDTAASSVAEVLAIACYALNQAGLKNLTIDLHYPSVFEMLLRDYPESTHSALREAARLKDVASLSRLGAPLIADILAMTGSASETLEQLQKLSHPALRAACAELQAITKALTAHQVEAMVTIDMLDLTGYGYYTGTGYAIFWNDSAIEVGRGGCYRAANGEDALGFTLYMNDMLDALAIAAPSPVKPIPPGTPAAEAAQLHAQGFVTLYTNAGT